MKQEELLRAKRESGEWHEGGESWNFDRDLLEVLEEYEYSHEEIGVKLEAFIADVRGAILRHADCCLKEVFREEKSS